MMFLKGAFRWRVRIVQALAGMFLLAGVSSSSRGARIELNLDGSWQYQNISQLNYPPPDNWQTITVPGFLSGWQHEHAWFRTSVTLPASMAGSRIKLRFGGVKFNAQVWFNGTFVGGYLNGYEPFEFDITSAALVGQSNELIIGVTDWTATFAAPVDFSNLGSNENPRNHVTNNIIAPIGGRYELYGIWQPVTVRSVPAVSIADVFVLPSVRSQQLTVRLTLRNDGATPQSVNVTNVVSDAGVPVFTLPNQLVNVPAGASNQIDITASWTNPHLWTHLDPHLYQLKTSLGNGTDQDAVATRFGFREFWTGNGRFFLNGTPINLLATATWPPTDLEDTNQIRKVLQDVRAGNNVAIRFHTQPWDEAWYDIADEVGILVVEECAVWCDPWSYQLNGSTFWTNYSQHVAAAVARDRNHPSIVLWSLENEILHCGGDRAYSGTESQLAALGSMLKGIDPTRPITYEADLDPGGVADALGLHYPHEFPDFQVWPNAAYWMDQPIARSWVPGGQWLWDRSKPLYIGEFLWVPSSSAADFTILFGDDAYADPGHYRNLAKGLTWRMQIEAYRAYGVSAMSPWTMFEDPAVRYGVFDLNIQSNYLYQAQKAAYEPNAVFVDQYDPRFFTGSTAQRTVHVYNDRMTPGDFTLRWRAAGGGWQSTDLSLPAAGRWQGAIEFPVPASSGAFPLELELGNAGTTVFTNTVWYSALAPTSLALPAGLKLGLYDPEGDTTALLTRFGVPFAEVTDLRAAAYDQFSLLMIGHNALTNQPLPEVGPDTLAAKWQDFASAGGWVLVLEQTNYPAWLPGSPPMADFDASFAFPNPAHPVTAGLVSDDLRWWAPDNRVVNKSVGMPSQGNFRALASVGSHHGLAYAAAVERPVGGGGLIYSQWPLTRRFDVEPMAGLLLQKLIDYCGTRSGRLATRPVALLAEPDSAAAVKLGGLGLLAENFSGRVAECNPSIYPVLVVAGNNLAWGEAVSQLPALSNYVAQGGALVLHRPPDSFLTAAQPVLFPELDSAAGVTGPILRQDVTGSQLHVANDDLYWIDRAGTWDQPEVLSTNIAARYYRRHFDLAAYSTIEVEAMPVHTTGAAATGGWLLWANGYVAQDIHVGQAGSYLFNVLASGTPVQGGWPVMSLRIDGIPLDSVTVPTDQPAFYTLGADLTAGTHQLAVSFDNDAYAPPEDRNLFLDRILWGRDADNHPATLLTRPGAVAQVRRGKGIVVLDEIEWDADTAAAIKADRYISRLLTDLGAAFGQAPGVGIAAVSMTNVNVAAYSASGGIANLYSNGRIETAVRFTGDGVYTFQFTAGGTPALGVLPEVGIVVDGVTRTNFLLASTALTSYSVTLSVTAGTHTIGLAFLNDLYSPPDDRNAAFGELRIAPPAAIRIIDLNPDGSRHAATLQWQSAPGRLYEVQTSPTVSPPDWQPVSTNAASASVASWEDTGQATGAPPLSPAAPRRFYRIRDAGP